MGRRFRAEVERRSCATMSETERLNAESECDTIQVELQSKKTSGCSRLCVELRKPGHIAGIVALSTLALIGVVSAIAYLHRDTSSDSATFIVISDYGTGSHIQQQVAAQLTKTAKDKNARFVLSLGNNLWPRGVENTTDKEWEQQWYAPYYGNEERGNMQSLVVPWYAALGNVDYMGNSSALLQYSRTLDGTSDTATWKMPDRNFAIKLRVPDSKPVWILIIDTSPIVYPNAAGCTTDQQVQQLKSRNGMAELEWLRAMLDSIKDSGSSVVVAGHHPIFVPVNQALPATMTNDFKSDRPARGMEPVQQLMEQYGVLAYLSGHVPIMGWMQHGPINYFVNGVGGCPDQLPNTCTLSGDAIVDSGGQYGAEQAGFMTVEASGEWIDFKFVSAQGKTALTKSVRRLKQNVAQ